jgi:multisubunit Na+/H+ antiporter MnhF subunit
MTAPTPKPDDPAAKAPPRRFRLPRPAALALAAVMAFAVFAVALIRVLPSPHTHADYLIVGTLATLAALIAIFAGLVMGRRKG